MVKQSEIPRNYPSILFVVAAAGGLYLCSLYSYLLFHSLIELFSVLIAFVIFVLAWNTRHLHDENYLLFIGIGAPFAGVLDLVHMLAYKGMGVFPGYGVDLATQLWIAFRFVFSFTLLLAPLFIGKKLNVVKAVAVYAVITALLLAAIFTDRFPACYVEGRGLTPFKIISEFIISLILIASLVLLLRRRRALEKGVLRLMALSILSSLASEILFTGYVSVDGLANMAGHFFELLSYYFIFHAIVVTGLVEPANLQFRELKHSEEISRENARRYRSLIELMPEAIAVHCGGKYAYMNPKGLELFGAASLDEVIGKDVLDFVHPDFRETVRERIGYVEKQGTQTPAREAKILRLDGQTVDIEAMATHILYMGKPAVQVILKDITERKHAEQALKESEAKFRSLFENMIDGFAYHKVVVDETGKPADYVFLEVNRAFEKLTGLKRQDIVGKRVTEALPGIENDPADWIGAYGAVALTEKDIRFEQYAGPLGRWYSVSAYSPMKEYFVTVFEDITERKRAEEALQKAHDELEARVADRTRELAKAVNTLQTEVSERLRVEQVLVEQSRMLEAFFKHSITPLVFLDKEFNFIRVNEAYAKACAREVSDFQNHNHFADYPSDELRGKFVRVVETKGPFTVSARPFTFPDHPEWGVTYWDLSLYPVFDSSGEVEFLVFALHDVTERKRAEENILRLNRLYSVLSRVNEAIVRIHEPQKLYEQVCRITVEDGLFKMAWVGITDPDTRMVQPVASCGDAGNYLNGIKIYAADVPEGRGPTGKAVFEGTYSICGDIEHDPGMLPWRDKALHYGFRSSAAFPLRAGSSVIGAFTIYSSKPRFFTDEEISLLSSLTDDISFAIDSMANEKKRLEAEESLHKSAEEIQDLYNNAPCGYHSVDEDGMFVRMNDTELHWLGYSREEVIGKMKFADLLTAGSLKTFEINFPRFKEHGLIKDAEYELTRKNGTILPILLSATAVRDSEGNYVMSRSTVYDITERRRAEEEVLRLNRELEQRVIERTAQLEAANKELEAFSYSVSHDLRAPLRIIDGFSRAIEDQYAGRLDETGRDYFLRVRAASQRMGQLIDALLNLSRLSRGELNRVTVDMSGLARAVADELGKTQPERRLEFLLAEGVTATGDPVMLRAVIENLLGNAWKFTEKRDPARIEFGVLECGLPPIKTFEGGLHADCGIKSQIPNPKSEVVYFVRDNGAGFDMTYVDKLFGAFQRLHASSEFPGLGIGLATVQRIVHRHGGRIWAEGEVDKGATFYFTL